MTKLKVKVNFAGQIIYVGLDVHLKSWQVCIYYQGKFIKGFTQIPCVDTLEKYLKENYPSAIYQCAYESGFCGYWIQRELTKRDINCIVVNAADIPQTDKGAKNKSDKFDAKRIGSSLQAGMLQGVYIPSCTLESDRQLVRCNDRFSNDLTRSKNRVKSLLYLLGIKLPEQFDNANWSNAFIQWLKQLHFDEASSRVALDHQLSVVEYIRKQKLNVLKSIRALLLQDRYKTVVEKLRTVPGVGPITAATFITEIGDMNRFKNFVQLNSFIGLCPTHHGSGDRDYDGSITTRQHRRLRYLLVEASWTAISNDPALMKVYSALKVKIGGKRAIVKIARKLLNRIRYVWINNKEYEKGLIQ
jgi:transposase